MMKTYILAIDQGTTGSRAFIYDHSGNVKGRGYREFKQYYPRPGWVEHDADEIWSSCLSVIGVAAREARISLSQIEAIGITNQRETTVLWDRKTSRPVSKAIVWQCRRTSEICQALRRRGLQPLFQKKTGLVLDPYFSGTKIRWLLDHVKGLRRRAEGGQVCFGTIDSWLIWKLTGGEVHATDYTNASRTLLFNIRNLNWDPELMKILKVPGVVLPRAIKSGSVFGRTKSGAGGLPGGIPITSVLGDQQAALYGQGCYSPGSMKNTYGTGCFAVMNTGRKPVYSRNGLLSTVASDESGNPVYALEGAVFIAGAAVQWLRDELKVIRSAADTEKIARGVEGTDGVYFVPAFTGLGAPYWDPDARGLITGLTRGANVKHIVRAALEAIAYQTKDVVDLMTAEVPFLNKKRTVLKVDGGAARNDFLMQFQADILNMNIVRPSDIDSTVKGAALLAGVTAGFWKTDELKGLCRGEKTFFPRMKPSKRTGLYRGWIEAVRQTQRGRSG